MTWSAILPYVMPGIAVTTASSMLAGTTIWLDERDPEVYRVRDWHLFLDAWIAKRESRAAGLCEVARQAMQMMRDAHGRLRSHPVKAVRIGSEHCDRCIPSCDAIAEITEQAQRTGVEVEVVLPVASDTRFPECERLLDYAAQRNNVTIVANDLGVLWGAAARHLRRLVMGRLLWKQKRLARMWPHEMDLMGPAVIAEHSRFEEPSWGKSCGVIRYDLDLVPQGLTVLENGARVAFHLPWSLLSFGRVCCVGSIAVPREDKFKLGTVCRHECNQLLQVYRDLNWPTELIQAGRAVYCLSYPKSYAWLTIEPLDTVVFDTTLF